MKTDVAILKFPPESLPSDAQSRHFQFKVRIKHKAQLK